MNWNKQEENERGMKGVSIVVVTRNRPVAARQAIASILASGAGEFEVVVVDQGDDPLQLPDHPRVRVLRSEAGLCLGRNLGIRNARFERIGCTDDDCIVPPEWVERVAEVLEDERVGLVFGTVRAGDAGTSVVPAHLNQEMRSARTPWQRNRIEGMGACMALRRRAWGGVGGFDEGLGRVTDSHAGDETDFAIRTLIAGWEVRTDPRLELVHLGGRQPHELGDLAVSYWRGTGAVFAKFLRLSPGAAVKSLLGLGVRWLGGGASEVARTTRVGRLARLRPFVRGFTRGWTAPLRKGCFARGEAGDGHAG